MIFARHLFLCWCFRCADMLLRLVAWFRVWSTSHVAISSCWFIWLVIYFRILLFMLNPDFSIFNDNMFVQVRKILDPLSIKTNLSPLNLTIGEPQIPPPEWLARVLIEESGNWQSYPKCTIIIFNKCITY